jgi:hypothetical protein
LSLPTWALVVIAVGGIAIGAAGAGGSSSEGSNDNRITRLQDKITLLEAQADRQASTPEETPEERAARLEAARLAEEQAAQEQAQLEQFLAEQEKNSIETGGIYEVGVDINPGRWRTDGPALPGDFCYYAILNSLDGSIDAIDDNNNIEGPGIFEIGPGKFLEVSGSCVWRRDG